MHRYYCMGLVLLSAAVLAIFAPLQLDRQSYHSGRDRLQVKVDRAALALHAAVLSPIG